MISIHLYFMCPAAVPSDFSAHLNICFKISSVTDDITVNTCIYTYITHKTPVIWHLGKNLSYTWTKMKTMENVISIKYFLPHQLQQHIKLEGNALPFYPEFFHRWINICSPLYNVRKIDIVELYYSPLYLKKRPVFRNAKMKSIVGLNLIMEKC